MLIQFTVENHRSIKNSAVISFAASKDKSFDEYLLRPDEKKALLPVLAIYGANAAGKSNVLHAMMTMKEMVVGNAAKVSKGQKLPWEPFGGTKVPTSRYLRDNQKELILLSKPQKRYVSGVFLLMQRRFTKSIFTIGRMAVKP